MENKKILAIIPARGGSKGIPRKNIRELNGKPLISYIIKTAKNAGLKYIYVSTDDDEIAYYAKLFGAKIIMRPAEFSKDNITLDPVIYQAKKEIEKKEKISFDTIITLQATSPLLLGDTLKKAISYYKRNDIETLISVLEKKHLFWYKKNDKLIPFYKKRKNRQKLIPAFYETGGFVITRSKFVKKNTRFGKIVKVYPLSDNEAIDIDDPLHWAMAEHILNKKKIAINIIGSKQVGMGHIYRALLLCDVLTEHDIKFFINKKEQLAIRKIKENNYPAEIFKDDKELFNGLERFAPQIVINDILDTKAAFVKKLMEKYFVIDFEDLGKGSEHAHLVINALYERAHQRSNHYYGHKYYIIRRDLQFLKPKNSISKKIKRIVITFGGTDENNYTERVLKTLIELGFKGKIDIVLGMGNTRYKELTKYKSNEISIYKDVKNMGELLLSTDMGITSYGRTIYEFAYLNVPVLAIAQNKRELKHVFAHTKNGIYALGYGKEISRDKLKKSIKKILDNYEFRKKLYQNMKDTGLSHGLKRIKELIFTKYLQGKDEK
ncbi:hypothetical protein J7L48_07710 [bacterium]|nr:hypothetical protein [bacterium]